MARGDKNKCPTENLSQNFPKGTVPLGKNDSSLAVHYPQIINFVEHLVHYSV
jgi:hypothetical protein